MTRVRIIAHAHMDHVIVPCGRIVWRQAVCLWGELPHVCMYGAVVGSDELLSEAMHRQAVTVAVTEAITSTHHTIARAPLEPHGTQAVSLRPVAMPHVSTLCRLVCDLICNRSVKPGGATSALELAAVGACIPYGAGAAVGRLSCAHAVRTAGNLTRTTDDDFRFGFKCRKWGQ